MKTSYVLAYDNDTGSSEDWNFNYLKNYEVYDTAEARDLRIAFLEKVFQLANSVEEDDWSYLKIDIPQSGYPLVPEVLQESLEDYGYEMLVEDGEPKLVEIPE
jgi:hypothetical protein